MFRTIGAISMEIIRSAENRLSPIL